MVTTKTFIKIATGTSFTMIVLNLFSSIKKTRELKVQNDQFEEHLSKSLRETTVNIAGGFIGGYILYRLGRWYYASGPGDVVITPEGSYYPGVTNAEGPPPTHNRTKPLPEHKEHYKDHQQELLELWSESIVLKREHYSFPEEMPFKKATVE